MKKHMRKRWISMLLCLAVLLSLCPMGALAAEGRTGNTSYYSNQGKLQKAPFVQLPMSAVAAKEWLLEQLLLQKNGMTGEMHDLYTMFDSTNGWRGGSGDGWERGPYYARGLIYLACALDDAELMEKAMEWIDFCLDSQRENGFFGPQADGDGYTSGWDWWPRMIMIEAVRDYYEYTEYKGNPDERVMPFFEKYFRFQLERLPGYPVTSWAAARAGDNAEVVLWYYNRVYDPQNPSESDWLIQVAEELMKNSHGIFGNYNDWTTVFTDSTVRNHVVNTTQAMKSPAVQYQYTGSLKDKNALREGLYNMSIDHGRVDGLANSDEWARDNLPYVGAETCSVVESIQSYGICMRILGDSWIGDDMERVAYNNLASCYTPDFTGQCYFQAQNQVMATNGAHEFIHDHGNSSAFAAPSGDACCISNMHMGWAKFVQNMWMATADDGLALVCYGPNTVTAQVAGGKTASFDQETRYPFDGDTCLTYSGDTAAFPLMLRVPEWCENPVFQINGQAVSAEIVDGYVTIRREWNEGDTVQISFPMEVRLSTWYNNSNAVERGPLIYTVQIAEDWHTPDPEMNDGRVLKISPAGVAPRAEYPAREVTPASTWNYALVYNRDDLASSFQVEVAEDIASQPFISANAPVRIKATGQIVPEWKLLTNVVAEPPYSPIAADENLQEEIVLIPYACSRLNIIQMPWVGEVEDTVVLTAQEGERKTQDGQNVLEFDNIMVPNGENYQLKVHYSGSGSLDLNINSKYTKTVEFTEGGSPYVLDDLVGLLPSQYDSMLSTQVKAFQFGYGQYNKIRFFGESGVTIESIEIVPQGKLESPEILSTKIDHNSITLNTNVARADGFYQVLYGTESGNYSTTASGFRTNAATITGLSENTTYYFKLTMLLDGQKVESQEISATTGAPEQAEVPEASFYDDFSDPTRSAQTWSVSGTPGVVSFTDGKMRFAADGNIKAFAGDENWTDYAVEATLSSPTTGGSDYGVVLRATNVNENGSTDAYNGYYVGLMEGGLRIGFSSQAWNLITNVDYPITANTEYQLKVLACGSNILIYVDGNLVYQFTDQRYTHGKIGARSWNKAFDVSSFQVRNLTESEIEEASQSSGGTERNLIYEDLTYITGDGVQLAYSRVDGNAKIVYGTESGVYDHELYELNSKFASDKASISGLEQGKTYYARIMNPTGTVYSQEFTFVPGTRPDLTAYSQKLTDRLAEAKAAQQSNYTEAAWARLQKSIADAEKVLNMDYANEMDYDLAANVLKIGIAETGIESRGVVTSVGKVEGINVGKFTSAEAISSRLPKEVEITYGDPAVTATAKITGWRCPGYDSSTAGEYTFYGTLASSDVYVNTNALKATAVVTVQDNVVRYEAEDAVVTAPAFVASHPSASGGKLVASIDNSNATITFTVEAPRTGEYEMVITADGVTAFPNASHKIYVNGDETTAKTVSYTNLTGWYSWHTYKTSVTLTAGTNTITFTHSGIDNSFAQLDCIDLVMPVEDPHATVRYEAEDGVLTAPAAIMGGSGSGGKYVGMIDNADASVTLTVHAPESGTYKMDVAFAGSTAFPNTSHKFIVNGDTENAQIIHYSGATNWGEFHVQEASIDLVKGENTIMITHSGIANSFAQIDYIDLTFAKGVPSLSIMDGLTGEEIGRFTAEELEGVELSALASKLDCLTRTVDGVAYTFAGWFTAPQESGNFDRETWTANVASQDDLAVENTIYAYYVNAGFLNTTIAYTSNAKKATRVYALSTVPGDIFGTYGFALSTAEGANDENLFVGETLGGLKVKDVAKTTVYSYISVAPFTTKATANAFNSNLGGANAGDGYLTYAAISNMPVNKTVSARAYYVTLDGTMVYGTTAQTLLVANNTDTGLN